MFARLEQNPDWSNDTKCNFPDCLIFPIGVLAVLCYVPDCLIFPIGVKVVMPDCPIDPSGYIFPIGLKSRLVSSEHFARSDQFPDWSDARLPSFPDWCQVRLPRLPDWLIKSTFRIGLVSRLLQMWINASLASARPSQDFARLA